MATPSISILDKKLRAIIALATVTILPLGVLFGKVHMAGGMLIHEASVLIVILNGMRLLRVEPHGIRDARKVLNPRPVSRYIPDRSV